MSQDDIWNERLKLFATYLNNLAVALVTAGVFGPIVSFAYGIIPNANQALVFLSTAGCFAFSGALHSMANSILGGLR
jgi:hypothetical protein